MMLTYAKKQFVGETVVWWSGDQVPWTQGPLYSHSTSRMNKIILILVQEIVKENSVKVLRQPQHSDL